MNVFFRLALILAILLLLPTAYADSVGSKNKEGNRLFEQGKYEEAEKTYLAAQVENPNRPELLYNLGNTLLKQKKYNQAMQELRKALAKGDKGIQANSWFNAGNALFEIDNFKDSAQAYIQSLRINPRDRDAKHNLELALKKMKEPQQQGQQNKNQNQDNDDQQKQDSAQNQQAENQEKKSKPEKQHPQAENPQAQQNPNKPVRPESTQGDRREGSFSKDRALQILDALQNQELAEQRKLLERRARRKVTGKDW